MKRLVYIAGVIIAVLLVQRIYDYIAPTEKKDASVNVSKTINKVFAKENILVGECTVEGMYYYGERYLSEDDERALLDGIAGELGVNSSYQYERTNTDTGSVVTLSKESDDAKILLKLITVELQENNSMLSTKHYISVEMNINHSVESAFYYKKLISKIINKKINENNEEQGNLLKKTSDAVLSKSNADSELDKSLYISFKGVLYGRINGDDQKKMAEKIIKEFGAKKQFDNLDDNYMIYGYSDKINEYISVGDKKVNVNITFGYDEEKDITTIYIGSPIINYDY